MLWDWVTLFLSLFFFDSFSTSTLEGLGFLILLDLSDCVRVCVCFQLSLKGASQKKIMFLVLVFPMTSIIKA